MAQIPVTVEGKRKLQEALAVLEVERPKIAAAIAEARERGDLKENAEYHAARELQGLNNAKIAELKSKIGHSVVVDESMIDTSTVAFGASLELEDLDDGSVEEWQLVGEGEDDPLENKILTSSPMGQALIGHVQGDEVSVAAPMGELRFKIIGISYS